MSSGTPGSKVCIVCHEDCSARPRVKDQSGRYICRACYDSRKTAPMRAAAGAAAGGGVGATGDAIEPLGDDAAAALFAAPAGSSAGGGAAMARCPNCNTFLVGGSVICMGCGFNAATGKRSKTRVKKAGSGAAGEVAGAAAGLLITANPIAWAIGGLIGAALGAGAWALIAVNLHREIGWIAWGVGVASGVGVALVARGNVGGMSGAIAAVIAIVGVVGGKAVSASLVVDEYVQGMRSDATMDDDELLMRLATDLADEAEARGEKLIWPPGMNNELASEESEFPKTIWRRATAKAAAWTPEEREAFRAEKVRARQEYLASDEFRAATEEAKSDFFGSLFGVYDALWIFLAVSSAYAIGSGAGLSGDD